MNPRDFVYWLQGFVEISGEQPTPEQWKMIKDHLQTVFHKVTPVPDEFLTTEEVEKRDKEWKDMLEKLKEPIKFHNPLAYPWSPCYETFIC